MTTWLVKAGEQAKVFAKFRDKSKVAVGWNIVGDFDTSGEWEEFRAEVKKRLPDDYSEQRVGSAAGQLWSFIRAMQKGDVVITPSAATREVLVGRVTGDYKYDPDFDSGLTRTREMKWLSVLPWDGIPGDLRSSFTAWQTIVRPGVDFSPVINAAESPNNASEILKKVEEQAAESKSESENLLGRAQKAVREKLRQMGHEDFQRFVGGLFVAAGFTQLHNSAGSGPDDGVDVILSKDPLGSGDRIVIQVKHTVDQTGQPEFQKLLGALRPGDYGLMVSLGDFSSVAMRFWRDHRDKILRPIGATRLIEMVNIHYESLADEYKVMLPLKRVLVPFALAEEQGDGTTGQ